MQNILIIEDNNAIAESLKLYLQNCDFTVFLHFTGEGALEKVFEIKPDLIILDINLPVLDGISICGMIRKSLNIPIIILTARNSELDKITWLEIWADDYIAKPFSPRELLARIHTILRRSENNKTNTSILSFDWIEIDIDKKIALSDNHELSLTWNEFELLKKIMEARGSIVSREVLMKEVMGYDNYLYDRTLDTHMKNLRKKLLPKDIIFTVRWEWYRLNS